MILLVERLGQGFLKNSNIEETASGSQRASPPKIKCLSTFPPRRQSASPSANTSSGTIWRIRQTRARGRFTERFTDFAP